MSDKIKKRDSNIELLRIITIMGVIFLHYSNWSIGGGFKYAPLNTINSVILYTLKSVFVCGVNLFLLITGYYMSNTIRVDIKKPIRLIIQVIFFRVLIYFIKIGIGITVFTKKTFFIILLPANYFVILYACVFCLAPYVNKLMNVMSKKALKKFMICIIVLFSIWPTLVEFIQDYQKMTVNGISTIGMYGNQSGYTIVNFLMLYMIGAYLRKIDLKRKYIKIKCLCGLVLCWFVLTTLAYYALNNGIGTMSVYLYASPLVILCAVLTFVLFINIEIKYNPIINEMSKATFTAYLTHIFLLENFVNVEKYVKGSALGMIIHIGVVCISLYLIAYVVYVVYNYITTIIYGILDKYLKSVVLDVEEK